MAIASPILIWFKPATALDCKVLAVVFIWFLESLTFKIESRQIKFSSGYPFCQESARVFWNLAKAPAKAEGFNGLASWSSESPLRSSRW